MKEINIPPYAPTLIESTRAIGYSLETALADIIDNSIAACADTIKLYYFSSDNPYIAILDNGHGMDSDELTNAMQYGSQSPTARRSSYDLGRFGLGLKTASLSQCRILTVISKKNNLINARRWDVDHVLKSQTWSLLDLNMAECQELPHFEKLLNLQSGTLVLWENLDRLKQGEINFEASFSKKFIEVRNHLELIYHRYLSGERDLRKTSMFMNDEPLVPADPFLTSKSTQLLSDETIIIRNSKITIRPYILPHISKLTNAEKAALGGKDGLRKLQGFYIYRNKRLLIWGTWFRIIKQEDLSKLARVQVDIPNDLDDLWTLDIKKSTAVPPAVIKQSLAAMIEKIAEGSKRTWEFRGRKETCDRVEHIWNRIKTREGGLIYEINRNHPLVKQFVQEAPQLNRKLEFFLSQVEGNIPWNQISLDINQDELKFEQTDRLNSDYLRSILDQLISSFNEEQKVSFLERMKLTEPFCFYPELIDQYIKEIKK